MYSWKMMLSTGNSVSKLSLDEQITVNNNSCSINPIQQRLKNISSEHLTQ